MSLKGLSNRFRLINRMDFYFVCCIVYCPSKHTPSTYRYKTRGKSKPLVSIANRCGCGEISHTSPLPGPSLKLTRRREIHTVSVTQKRVSTLRDDARKPSSLRSALSRGYRGTVRAWMLVTVLGWMSERELQISDHSNRCGSRSDKCTKSGMGTHSCHYTTHRRDRDIYSAYFVGKRAVKTSSYVHL